MFPLTIIEQLKVLENVRLGFFSRFIVLVENPFSFQLAEEAFDRRVIPAVAFAAHAASDVMVLQKLSEGIGRILTAAVAVMQKACFGTAMNEGHPQRIENQIGLERSGHRPADDPSRKQVHHDRQIKPALGRGDIRDIGRPLLVHGSCLEVAIQVILRHMQVMV